MLQSRNVIAGLAGLLLVLAAALPAAAGEEDLYVFERSLYLLAERALNRGDMTAYRAARSTLTGYPLTPYLDYRDLARNLNRADPDAVRRFVREHDDTPLAARLHGSYLTHLAREEQWGAVSRIPRFGPFAVRRAGLQSPPGAVGDGRTRCGPGGRGVHLAARAVAPFGLRPGPEGLARCRWADR